MNDKKPSHLKVYIQGQITNLGSEFQGKIMQSLMEVTTRHFSNPLSAEFTLSREGVGYKASVDAHPAKKVTVHASAVSLDAQSAANEAIDRIGDQLQGYKGRVSIHRSRRIRANGNLGTSMLADSSLTSALPSPDTIAVSERDEEKAALAQMGIPHLTPLVANLPKWKPEPYRTPSPEGSGG